MSLFTPDLFVEKITDVKIETFEKLNVKAVFLDVDNTLCSHSSKKPIEGAIQWVNNVKSHGYKVYIVSNNYKERVSAVAKIYDLPFVSFATKPFPRGFSKAAKMAHIKKHDCVIIGDQIFTDILGANLAGMKSVLVEPVEPTEKGISIAIRRHFEKGIKNKLVKMRD